jgi:hypothetical protein
MDLLVAGDAHVRYVHVAARRRLALIFWTMAPHDKQLERTVFSLQWRRSIERTRPTLNLHGWLSVLCRGVGVPPLNSGVRRPVSRGGKIAGQQEQPRFTAED